MQIASTEVRVSIVVVHYGEQERLSQCLKSIIANTQNIELIVVDNNQLPEGFDKSFPNAKLIRSEGNIGFGAACNAGARVASGTILVFMNNDVEVNPGWVGPLIQPLREGSIGCTCPLVVLRNTPDVVNAAGGDCDLIAFAWNRRSRGTKPDGADQADFFYAPGCCIAVRKDALNQVCGFDESLFLFLEDVDLSWRLRMAGWHIAYASDSVVRHEWMASTSRMAAPDIQYLFSRNRLRLILKNYGGLKLVRVLPTYFALQIGLLLWITSRRRGLELRAVLAGWLWNFQNLPDTIRARMRAQFVRRRSDNEIMRYMYSGIAGIHLVLGTMKNPVLETHFSEAKNKRP
jgi:GT2 family glycosyltransferase